MTITGKGMAKSYQGKAQTWFATQCTSAVQGHLDVATDTPHCDITHAIALKVARNGTFIAHFSVLAGIVGDGYCGTAGHLTCVIGVGTAQGLGTVVHISFKAPPAYGATTTTHLTPPRQAPTQASCSHSRWLKPIDPAQADAHRLL